MSLSNYDGIGVWKVPTSSRQIALEPFKPESCRPVIRAGEILYSREKHALRELGICLMIALSSG